jgi:flagella basal body P-ring formation protein FlgA
MKIQWKYRFRRSMPVVLCVIIGLLCGRGIAAQIRIDFYSRVHVKDTVIRLGDVARIDCADEAMRHMLKELYVRDVPPPNRDYILRRLEIVHILARHGITTDQISFSGAERIAVRGCWVEIPPSEILARASDELQRIVAEVDREVRCFVVSDVRRVWVPDGKYEVIARGPSAQDLKSRVPVRVEIQFEGRAIAHRIVCFELNVFEEIAVACTRIERHDVIQPGQVKMERRDITDSMMRVISSRDDVRGKRVRRSIRPGECIYRELVENPPDIERGSPVRVIVRKGCVEITATGTALENGMVGEDIRVLVLSTRKRMSAQVLDHTTVVVPL